MIKTSQEETTWILGKDGKQHKRYRSFCMTCGKDKGYIRKCRLNKECHSCNSTRQAEIGRTHNGKSDEVLVIIKAVRQKQVIKISDDTKKKIAKSNRETWKRSRQDQIPWNKGSSNYSREHKHLSKNTRSLLFNYLKKRDIRKDGKTFILLGYSTKELLEHLESKFLDGMTWDNYGKWHVDHIRPDSSFQYKSTYDKDFKECWALSNLQPLWAKDNLKKGNKYDF